MYTKKAEAEGQQLQREDRKQKNEETINQRKQCICTIIKKIESVTYTGDDLTTTT